MSDSYRGKVSSKRAGFGDVNRAGHRIPVNRRDRRNARAILRKAVVTPDIGECIPRRSERMPYVS
jgi:hypothetical protein